MDERKNKGGIQLTDNFFRLGESLQFSSLADETEARWKLVEAAWGNNISHNLMQVSYEQHFRQFL